MALISLSSERRVRDLLVPELPVRATREQVLLRARPGRRSGEESRRDEEGAYQWVGGVGVSLQELEIYPVSVYGQVGQGAVFGARVGPIPGPFLVRWFRYSLGQTNSNNFHTEQIRVDFSPVDGLDTFTSRASATPLGRSSAPYTLFPYNWYNETNPGPEDQQMPGWLSSANVRQFDPGVIGDLAVKIPLPSAYIKVYLQNDAPATQIYNFRLGISPLSHRLSAALSVEVPAVRTVEGGGGSAPGGGAAGFGQIR